MIHVTCDKCGMPMESENSMTIGITKFDICGPCQDKIMDGLKGKGKPNVDFEEIKRRYSYREQWPTFKKDIIW